MNFSKCEDKCGCFFTKELDMDTNIINKKYIKICANHSEYINIINKDNYTFNKKSNFYILKTNTISLKKKILNNNLKSLGDGCKKIKFGKYKNKSYDFVYSKDKTYCYNLCIWTEKEIKDDNVNDFIKYIKNCIYI